MRLKQGFLKIHFSNYACSVAREDPSDMPAKTPKKSVQTNTQTHRQTYNPTYSHRIQGRFAQQLCVLRPACISCLNRHEIHAHLSKHNWVGSRSRELKRDNFFFRISRFWCAHFRSFYLGAQWEYEVVLWICFGYRWGKPKKVVITPTHHPYPWSGSPGGEGGCKKLRMSPKSWNLEILPTGQISFVGA